MLKTGYTISQTKYKEDLETDNFHRSTCTAGPLVYQEMTTNQNPNNASPSDKKKKKKTKHKAVIGLLPCSQQDDGKSS